MRKVIPRASLLLAAFLLLGAAHGAVGQDASPKRLTVAVLWFADRTGDPQAAHWRYSLTRLMATRLYEVKAIRLTPHSARDYAYRQQGVKKGAPLDAGRARKMGELIEAQRVVWGDYRREGGKWQVTARVLNVAGRKASAEFKAASADWFEITARLTADILKELGITPTEAERAKMARRWTTSPTAWEWFSKADALRAGEKPSSEQEESLRNALMADPQFVKAQVFLAVTLGNQGKYTQGEETARQALKISAEEERAHGALGFCLIDLIRNRVIYGA